MSSGKWFDMDPLDHSIRYVRMTRYRRTKPGENELLRVTRNELSSFIGFRNCYLFVKVDQANQPEKWAFSEYPDSVNDDTAAVFTREWSNVHSTHVVVYRGDMEDFLIVDGLDDKFMEACTTTLYNYEDFVKMYTSKHRTSYKDPPVYVRDHRKALYKMWLNHIVRANNASPDLFSITEDTDRYDDLKKQLWKIISGGATDTDKYEAIRKMVLNYDLISEEARSEYFP